MLLIVLKSLFHLAMAHQLNVSIFWELTKYVSQETNYVAWYPIIKAFEYMSTIFPFLPYQSGYVDIKVMANGIIIDIILQKTLVID